MRKDPKSTADAASIITAPPPTARSASRCTRSSGCGVRSSSAAKAASPASPAPPMPSVCADVQPAAAASESAYTSAPKLAVASAAPRRSRPRHRGRAVSAGTIRNAPAPSTRPTGRLMTKIARQSTSSVRAPPSSTPIAAPAPPTAPQTPSALARSRPSLNVVMMIDSAAGDSIAAPRPCPARAANRSPAPPPAPTSDAA